MYSNWTQSDLIHLSWWRYAGWLYYRCPIAPKIVYFLVLKGLRRVTKCITTPSLSLCKLIYPGLEIAQSLIHLLLRIYTSSHKSFRRHLSASSITPRGALSLFILRHDAAPMQCNPPPPSLSLSLSLSLSIYLSIYLCFSRPLSISSIVCEILEPVPVYGISWGNVLQIVVRWSISPTPDPVWPHLLPSPSSTWMLPHLRISQLHSRCTGPAVSLLENELNIIGIQNSNMQTILFLAN